MLTSDEFDAVEKDDLVKIEPLFKGLTPEPIELACRERTTNSITFKATWFGISLGRWVLSRDSKGKLTCQKGS